MNRKELNELSMLKSVREFLNLNEDALKTYAPIVQAKVRLNADIEEIELLGETQATDTKSEFAIKTYEKQELNANVLKVSAALTAVAASTSDLKLRAVSDIDKTALNRLREGDYNIRVKAIVAAARPIVEQLAVWGVTPADLDAIEDKSGNLMKKIPALHNKKIITKQASVDLKQKLSDTKKDLTDTLDALMLPFQTLNPTLHAQYKSARKLVSLSATHKKPEEEVKLAE